MMGQMLARIERAENGFSVEMCDPAIKKRNDDSDGDYKDPYVTFVFKTTAEVTAFLDENLDAAMPMDDFATSFTEAAKESST